jgi:PPOX class probable F420-dependent enzyme
MAGLSDWARALLEGRHYATLATQDADGSLHQTPVWYLFRDDQLFVGCPSFSRKARNAMARPTASLVVDVRKPGAECWVAGIGPVTIVRGDQARALVRAIQERYLTPEALAHPRIGPGFAAVDDVTLNIRPATWRSWTSRDVDAQYFGGLLTTTPEKWFRPVD